MRVTILITLLAFVACCRAGTRGDEFTGTQGDFTAMVAGNDSRMKDVLDHVDQDWLADSVLCKAGAYTLLAPRDRTRNQYLLLRVGAELPEVLRLGSDNVVVMDGYSLHATLIDSNKDGHADTVGYSTWHYGGDRYVNAEDFNLHGQPDLRHTETADGGTRREAWVNSKWNEVILKNGFRLAASPETRLRKANDGSFEIADTTKP